MGGTYVAEWLTACGLATLLETFEANEIFDKEDLQLLSKEDVRELIPAVGLRNRFLRAMTRFQAAHGAALPETPGAPPADDAAAEHNTHDHSHSLTPLSHTPAPAGGSFATPAAGGNAYHGYRGPLSPVATPAPEGVDAGEHDSAGVDAAAAASGYQSIPAPTPATPRGRRGSGSEATTNGGSSVRGAPARGGGVAASRVASSSLGAQSAASRGGGRRAPSSTAAGPGARGRNGISVVRTESPLRRPPVGTAATRTPSTSRSYRGGVAGLGDAASATGSVARSASVERRMASNNDGGVDIAYVRERKRKERERREQRVATKILDRERYTELLRRTVDHPLCLADATSERRREHDRKMYEARRRSLSRSMSARSAAAAGPAGYRTRKTDTPLSHGFGPHDSAQRSASRGGGGSATPRTQSPSRSAAGGFGGAESKRSVVHRDVPHLSPSRKSVWTRGAAGRGDDGSTTGLRSPARSTGGAASRNSRNPSPVGTAAATTRVSPAGGARVKYMPSGSPFAASAASSSPSPPPGSPSPAVAHNPRYAHAYHAGGTVGGVPSPCEPPLAHYLDAAGSPHTQAAPVSSRSPHVAPLAAERERPRVYAPPPPPPPVEAAGTAQPALQPFRTSEDPEEQRARILNIIEESKRKRMGYSHLDVPPQPEPTPVSDPGAAPFAVPEVAPPVNSAEIGPDDPPSQHSVSAPSECNLAYL